MIPSDALRRAKGSLDPVGFSLIAKKHVNFAIGSEFTNYHDFLTKDTLLICISQSGETADTLAAMRYCQGQGQHY